MLFSGDSIPNDSTPDPTDTIINWNPLDTTIIPPTPNDSVNDTTSTSYFYFPISGFGWLNCDYFYGNTNSTNISIKIDGFNYLNCYVYLFFRDMHSLLPILYSTTSFEGFSIPIGQNVTIIAIGEKEGQYFSRFEDITISPNATLILEMNPTTEAQINKTLDNL
jgi:hypothetical protein